MGSSSSEEPVPRKTVAIVGDADNMKSTSTAEDLPEKAAAATEQKVVTVHVQKQEVLSAARASSDREEEQEQKLTPREMSGGQVSDGASDFAGQRKQSKSKSIMKAKAKDTSQKSTKQM